MRLFGITLLTFLSSIGVASAQCGTYPVLQLGNDTTLCLGQSVNISVPPGYDYFSWNVVSGNPTTINVSSAQTVVLEVQNIDNTNLVVNGDFESDNTGFTTGYNPGSGGAFGLLTNAGTYAITTSPNLVHNNFTSCSDVTTTGPGNMMVVNGSTIPNTQVWGQNILVDPNTTYNFSAWVTAVETSSNNLNKSSLQFFVNGVQIGPIFQTTLTGCDWHQFFETWNSGANTTAALSIVAQATSGNNDFAIDNISFTPICIQTDSITISYDQFTINAGADITFCANEQESLTATSTVPNANFVWETGATTATISPLTSGYYTVATMTPNGCLISDSALVTVTPMPWDFDIVGSQPTDCGVNNGAVFVTTSGTFNDPPYYTWNGPGASNPSQINASVWQNLSSGWYYISIESAGCYRYDSVFVDVNNPPTAVLGGNPLTGNTPLTVTFTNSSTNSNDFDWAFGNGNTTSTTDLSSQTQTYDTEGTYQIMLVANQGNCSDTAYVTVVVTDPPIVIPPVIVPVNLSYPNVFSPNGDNVNDFFEFEMTGIKAIEIDVVNRWGEIVFSSTDVNFKWDGKIGSLLAAEGVYFFQYKATGAQEENLEGQGFVQIVK